VFFVIALGVLATLLVLWQGVGRDSNSNGGAWTPSARIPVSGRGPIRSYT
jgi:hypothetical protein